MASIKECINEDGSKVFRVRVRRKGYPIESASFARITDARRWAQKIEAAIQEGRHFKGSEAKRHTVADLIDRYQKEVVPHRPKNKRNIDCHLKWWRAAIGHLLLSDLTTPVLVKCRDTLANTLCKRGKTLQKRSGATVTRYLATLSHALGTAVKEWHWLDDSPMRRVSKPRASPGRVRYLSDAERHALLAAAKASKSKWLYAIVVLALSTGMRRGEILNLRWNRVDVDRGWIVLEETKNGDRRGIPLVGHACEVLAQMRQERGGAEGLLFPGKRQDRPVDIKKAWATAVKSAGLADFRFHDLRHSAASYLAMNGATPSEIADLLGHKTLQMVKRYAHISNQHTTRVVASMNAGLFGVR